MTLYSLTNAPDVWKCGVAGAPVTHWKFYDTIYTERYMSLLGDNLKGYVESAPIEQAPKMRGNLLRFGLRSRLGFSFLSDYCLGRSAWRCGRCSYCTRSRFIPRRRMSG